MSSPIRLIAIDIDGTLLDSHFQVSEHNLATLCMAHSMGVEIVLATGRRHTFAVPVAQALGFDTAIISSNGAITRSTDGTLFHRDPLPLSDGTLLAVGRTVHAGVDGSSRPTRLPDYVTELLK